MVVCILEHGMRAKRMDTEFKRGLMETNMHDMRHSFFDINRSMVEDVSDILIRKQKASSRLRLVKREQNVWSFASAPKYIVNK